MIGFLTCGVMSCSYHNDDNPNEYPELKPEPEPSPEPKPELNEKYLKAIYSANSLMVKPQETVSIPIIKAYAMWNLYSMWMSESLLSDEMPQAVLLWQDLPNLIRNVGFVQGQTYEDSQMIVSTTNQVGNAVVGIQIGGKIRWSWHLWVTPYEPNADLVAYGKIYPWDNNQDGVTDYVFMDRNLGAVIDKAVIDYTPRDSLAACGVLYQWGRKDPFPSDHHFRYTNQTDYDHFESKPIYNLKGDLLMEGSARGGNGIQSHYTDEDLTLTGLEKSILFPMNVLLGKGGYSDWYCSQYPLSVEQCDTLWNEQRGKTPFDPCPEGWRVPADKNGQFAWNGFSQATMDSSPLGVFPYTGFRYRVGGGCLKNSGFSASLWSGIVPKIGNAPYLSIYIVPYNNQPAIKREVGCRSDCRSVRCVKCD